VRYRHARTGEVLGVMNITLLGKHPFERKEEQFLTAVANALAGVMERKRVERELAVYPGTERCRGIIAYCY